MPITSCLFEAFLKCQTKCYLLSLGERATGNEYADWVRMQNESYRSDGIKHLTRGITLEDCASSLIPTENVISAKWNLAISYVARALDLESAIHAVEKVTSEARDKPEQFIPIRFIFKNKLSRDDKLLLAFDALALSETLKQEVGNGKIIHGHDRSTLKVKIGVLASEVQKLTKQLRQILTSDSPPDLVLNRHCAECEFQARCRQKAIALDDLSLLSAVSANERNNHRSKGIFTVTQLSYTFRPRKTPKRAKNPAKPRYMSLQARAIRENTVYIHGNPQLPNWRNLVYLDIEGIPDSEFYYLIGALFVSEGQETFHTFWADQKSDEIAIFAQFIEAVGELADTRILHFGNYERIALKRMRTRLPECLRPKIDAILARTTNVLSIIHPHLYFPTYSNGLKEIGRFLGFQRADQNSTGLDTIVWRKTWETNHAPDNKARLLQYNKDDCHTLKQVFEFILGVSPPNGATLMMPQVSFKNTQTEELNKERPRWDLFRPREYASQDLKKVAKCAYFDYQREKVYVRTHPRFKVMGRKRSELRRHTIRINKVQRIESLRCPECQSKKIEKHHQLSHDVIDLKFFRGGMKRWVTRFLSWQYTCSKCNHVFNSEKRSANPPKYGHGLMSWFVYGNVSCGMNMLRMEKSLGDVFGFVVPDSEGYRSKTYIAALYHSLYPEILKSILASSVIHIDETTVRLRKQAGYVWVMTTLDKVYYFYKPSREGSFLQDMLGEFSGVLVSDFFTAYDSLACDQQKCLVHLLRDIDDDLLRNPLDTEFKSLAQDFGTLLRTIIETVDRYGLKKRHLHKHKRATFRFLASVNSVDSSSPFVTKYKKRFQKYGEKLFTFLDRNGVPWNNTNAEHAIKRIAKYRMHSDGCFTERSLQEYLVLATVFETCAFNNVNVLKFLLSRETTLEGLLKMVGGRRNRHETCKPINCQSPQPLCD